MTNTIKQTIKEVDKDFTIAIRTKGEHKAKVYEVKEILNNLTNIDKALFIADHFYTFKAYKDAVNNEYNNTTKVDMDNKLKRIKKEILTILNDLLKYNDEPEEIADVECKQSNIITPPLTFEREDDKMTTYKVIDTEGRTLTLDIEEGYYFTSNNNLTYIFDNLEQVEKIIYNIDEDAIVVDENNNAIITNVLGTEKEQEIVNNFKALETLTTILEEMQEIDPNGTHIEVVEEIRSGGLNLNTELQYYIKVLQNWLSENSQDIQLQRLLNEIKQI